MKKTAALLAATLCITSSFSPLGTCVDKAYAANGFNTNVNIDISGKKTSISPYIYGINDGCSPEDVTSTAMRQGGNRYTAYNWETNYSNAGEGSTVQIPIFQNQLHPVSVDLTFQKKQRNMVQNIHLQHFRWQVMFLLMLTVQSKKMKQLPVLAGIRLNSKKCTFQ